MVKSLNKKAEELLLSNLGKNSSIIGAKDYTDYFETINSFLYLGKIDEAERLLKKVLEFWKKEGYFYFDEEDSRVKGKKVSAIYFLENFALLCEKVDDNKILKKYIKNVKRCFETIENQFDEIYLLYYHLDYEERKIFEAYENAVLSYVGEVLFDKLNEIGENDFADRIFMLKGKLDLGFQRYFWQKEDKVLLKKFSPEISFYEIADEYLILKVFEKLIFNKEFYLSEINKIKKKITKENNMEKILITLNLMRKYGDESWKKEFSNIEKYLKYFPLIIERKLKIEQSIEKSIFFGFNAVFKKFEKEKVSIFDLESLKIINLVLKFDF